MFPVVVVVFVVIITTVILVLESERRTYCWLMSSGNRITDVCEADCFLQVFGVWLLRRASVFHRKWLCSLTGSLLSLHGREPHSRDEPRGRGGQRWLRQWREPNRFNHQENHHAASTHRPHGGALLKALLCNRCNLYCVWYRCFPYFHRLTTHRLRKTSTMSTRSSAAWMERRSLSWDRNWTWGWVMQGHNSTSFSGSDSESVMSDLF